jgi:hypothetical protein
MTTSYESIYGDPNEQDATLNPTAPIYRVGIRRNGFRWAVDLLEYADLRALNFRQATVVATEDARNRIEAATIARSLVA